MGTQTEEMRRNSLSNMTGPEEFYAVEIYLETLFLDVDITGRLECNYNLRSPLRAIIQIGDIRTTPVEKYQGSRLVIGDDKEKYEFTYNTGRDHLFSLPPSECLRRLFTSCLRIHFETQDADLKPPLWFRLGSVHCQGIRDLVQKVLLSGRVYARDAESLLCPVMHGRKGKVGTLRLNVSLTAMGTCVVTEIEALQANTFLYSSLNTYCMDGKPKQRGADQVAALEQLYESLVKATVDCKKKEKSKSRERDPPLIERELARKEVQKFVKERQAAVGVVPRILPADFLKTMIDEQKKANKGGEEDIEEEKKKVRS